MNTNKSTETFDNRYDVVLDSLSTHVTPRTKPIKKRGQTSGLNVLNFTGTVGFDFAVPLIAGFLVGAFLDKRWGTHPWVTLVLSGIGLVMSGLMLVKTFKDTLGKT